MEATPAPSRLRLRLATVDALVVHDLDRGLHGETLERRMAELTGSGLARLRRMKAEGEISARGMGISRLADFAGVAEWVEVDFYLVATLCTPLDQRALCGPMARRAEPGPRCRRHAMCDENGLRGVPSASIAPRR